MVEEAVAVPIYSYKCKCGWEGERFCTLKRRPSWIACESPDCTSEDGKAHLTIGRGFFHLKGDRWAKDGYAGGKK